MPDKRNCYKFEPDNDWDWPLLSRLDLLQINPSPCSGFPVVVRLIFNHLIVNKMSWVHLYIKHFSPSFLSLGRMTTINKKEGNVLFNNALNTFYLWLYGVRHMVKDHSDSQKGNPLPPHRLLLSINSKGSFICTIPDRITHTMVFVTPVVEHWLEREIAQWVHPMKDRSDDPLHHERTKVQSCPVLKRVPLMCY